MKHNEKKSTKQYRTIRFPIRLADNVKEIAKTESRKIEKVAQRLLEVGIQNYKPEEYVQ